MSTTSYLPYHEPSLPELLITSTFLLSLNAINSLLDRTLACGLIGQVLIGTAWGAPGAHWLSLDSQRVISSLGYLGLILIVHAGGAETNIITLRKNLILSLAVAITGVVVPIALSFALLASDNGMFFGKGGEPVMPLQAFAAGAALCSTSLGTTFSVLQSSGLSRTRLGAVLASAALLDDVVGLVMVRIITSLGKTGPIDIESAVLRPVLVSIAFAVVILFACNYMLKPAQKIFERAKERWDHRAKASNNEGSNGHATTKTTLWIRSQEAGFVFQTSLLILLIVAADYAGASILLAAYLAGVVVSWWDSAEEDAEVPVRSQPVDAHASEIEPSSEQQPQNHTPQERRSTGNASSSHTTTQEIPPTEHTTFRVFDTYYSQTLNRILKPFFFASIGFSIPISQLFLGKIAWRGIIYILLMTIGKLVCGLWLVRFPISILAPLRGFTLITASKYHRIASKIRLRMSGPKKTSRVASETQLTESPTTRTEPERSETTPQPNPTPSPSPSPSSAPKPLSLYPAAVIGCAMVARGEIGFLIASTAESHGVFRRPGEDASKASELFLIVTWAIFLCTILGPLFTGLLVRRIKKLEKASEASRGGGARNVLGVWGVTTR